LTGLPGDRGRRKSKTKKSFAGHRRDGRVLDLQKEMVPEISSGIGDNPRPTHHIAETKKILTVKNLAGYRRAQQDEGQIRRGDVSYVDTKKFPAIFAQSVGRQLPDTALQNKPGTKKILTEKNLAGYRRAQQDEGQIRRGDVSYVDTKKASELLGRSGLQLPRVPSLNTGQEGF
jgi:hypothetical protein